MTVGHQALFRERDRDSMRFSFDLWSWPAERVAVFSRWIETGKAA
jgi:hypothetical protein